MSTWRRRQRSLRPDSTPRRRCRTSRTCFTCVVLLTQSYQAELLAKRELLANYTCEEIGAQQFAAQWHTLDEVQQGRKQEMDDLADLLANFG